MYSNNYRSLFKIVVKKLNKSNVHQPVNGSMVVCPHSAMLLSNKKEEPIIHAMSWKNLKSIMLSKINNTQNITSYMTLFILHLWKRKTIVIESRFVVDWSQRCGKQIDCKEAKRSFRADENVLSSDCDGDYMIIKLSKLTKL